MHLKVVSPTKILFDETEINEVYVPGTNGEIGILKGHTNLVAALDVGIVKVKTISGAQNIIINGGFIQVTHDEILSLVDEGSLPQVLVVQEIEDAIKRAEKQISTESLPPTELIRLEKELRYHRFRKSQSSM